MSRKKRLKLLLACILMFMTTLIGYRGYLFIYETDYEALNADHIDRIETRLQGKETFKFAVIGNLRNSILIFN